jgi:AAA+ ATPase superfamily predicted ATPase
MKFLDRKNEFIRLNSILKHPDGGLVVVYGRRRVGKTRLLLEWSGQNDGVYWVADESTASIQRTYFAQAIATKLKNFADVTYPDWQSLFSRLAKDTAFENWRGPLIIDELPYLVSASPELPSILQKWIDHDAQKAKLITIICGSSQRMMHGLFLNASAPLFGRAKELFKVSPLPLVWLKELFPEETNIDLVKMYSVWGGIPRYWDLVFSKGGTIDEQVDDLVLNSQGPLHNEPDRLLHDEIPSAISLRPILDAIGMGAHKISEIAGRIGLPSTSISTYLNRLIELDLISRDIPFGESEKSSKKSLYSISDPFFQFWFTIVAPHRGILAQGTRAIRLEIFHRLFPSIVSKQWEQICRNAVKIIPSTNAFFDTTMGVAKRYWAGKGPEWDIVASDIDNKTFLIGECKWSEQCTVDNIRKWERELLTKGIPPVKNMNSKNCKWILFVPQKPNELSITDNGVYVADISDILNWMKPEM